MVFLLILELVLPLSMSELEELYVWVTPQEKVVSLLWVLLVHLVVISLIQ